MGHIPNIDAISGALFTLRIHYEYIQAQCDEGARDGLAYGDNIIHSMYS